MPRLALLLTTFVWGATFPATKAALEQIPPFAFLFIRFALALCLAGLAALAWRLVRRDAVTLSVSAIASLYMLGGYTLQTVGLRDTSASNSAFITALYVVFVPLLLRRFDPRTWLSAVLAVLGLWLLVSPTVAGGRGDLLTLGGAVAFAAHIAALEEYTRRVDGLSLFVWQLVFVTIALAALWGLEAWGAAPAPVDLTPVVLLALFITGVLATAAFAVQIWVQSRLAAHRVALIFSLEPAFAAWLAWYFLDEQLTSISWLGSGVILVAVVLGATRPSAADTPERRTEHASVTSEV